MHRTVGQYRRTSRFAALGAALALALIAAPVHADQPPNTAEPGGKLPGNVAMKLVKVADGFVDPINVVCPKDGSGRLFVIERPGVVRIIKDGKVLKKPFLDIKQTVVSSFLEQGLYDLEFHPKFKENGQFFVHYSDMWFNGDSFIARYNVDPDDENKADRKSVKVIMTIDQPYANHNGGELVFGPDGYLYIGSGDGGWEGDVLNAGQRLDTLLAKILRIDVDHTDSDRAYSIPKTNPFQTPKQQMVLFGVSEEEFAKVAPTAKPEIWAYGVRNPVKMQFDRKTGDLYIADVGQNHWEEVSFQPANSKGGENYGWKMMCGTHPFPIGAKDAPKVGIAPIAQYNHAKDGICVIGFGVARGPAYKGDADGVYFFGDWGSGKFWGVKRGDDGKWVMQEMADTKLMFTGAGEDEQGNIYVTTAHANYGGPVNPEDNPRGAVWKLVPADQVPAGAETAPLE
ncbi:MAG: hypothetical protein GC159_05315 [Phycisphaera sp.]|nr:hypothetical protein [Phycisphaera sp.]